MKNDGNADVLRDVKRKNVPQCIPICLDSEKVFTYGYNKY